MTPSHNERQIVRLLLTMGDPFGIGPELCVRILQEPPLSENVALSIVGSSSVLKQTAENMGAEVRVPETAATSNEPGALCVLDLDNLRPDSSLAPGPTADGGQASLQYIERAVKEIQAGRADALITAPISKEAIGAAGSPFPGHTEMLGSLTDTSRPVMLLINDSLHVAFTTTHLAVRDVADRLTRGLIVHTGCTFASSLQRDFGAQNPVLALCALNPHSGDGGRFGDEEARLIEPAAEKIRQQGFQVKGPYPSDTLFARALKKEFDGVVAMYHDQGMIPIKISGVERVVNVTLGLPFVRTSPGHGTAYDIAGQGIADVSSTVAAIQTAASMVRRRREHK